MNRYDMFPNVSVEDIKKDPLSCQAFGKRITGNQTLYEYLLEFLLIFCSPKKAYAGNGNEGYYECDDSTRFHFHDIVDGDSITYYVNPRIALKRFIFFSNSKRDGKFLADQQCYDKMIEIMENKITSDDNELCGNLQDLFYGYSAVLKSRSWFAQSTLPLCPEVLFNESLGNKTLREHNLLGGDNVDYTKEERKFKFTQHDFMARGGEVYYLHILQSVNKYPEYKEDLELGIKRLVSQVPQLSSLAEFIQGEWEKETQMETRCQEYKCAYIPADFEDRSLRVCKELSSFMSTSINTLRKIELLAKGIILQMCRVIHEQACLRIGKVEKPVWIIDMRCGNSTVKTFAEKSYRTLNEDVIAALAVGLDNLEYITEKSKKLQNCATEIERQNLAMKNGREESVNVIKKLGKEIKLIIPAKGDAERFSLSEDILTFLVLSIVNPGEKVTFEGFLDLLYQHFGMIISFKHMGSYCIDKGIDSTTASYFKENEKKFQAFMKNCGFLKELSDATAIVQNPYDKED